MHFLWYSPYFLRMKSSVDSVLLLSNHQMQKKVKADKNKRNRDVVVDSVRHKDKYHCTILLVLYLLLV